MQLRRRTLPKLLGLQAFEATARLGSVSRAASELCLTQGAVSRQIQALETQVGVQLFVRSKKRLLLTEAGAGYLHDVRDGLAALGDATDALVTRQGRGGTLGQRGVGCAWGRRPGGAAGVDRPLPHPDHP